MAIPTHVADHIEAIKVGESNFAFNANLINGHTWSDITDLVATGFAIKVYDSLPPVPTSSQADKDAFYNDHKAELALVQDASATAGIYIEYVLVKSGESPSFNYAWEAIGTTQTDLSNYVQKETITLTGETGSAGAQTINTTSDGEQTASGTVEISYNKAISAATSGSHVHTISPITASITYSNANQTGATGETSPNTGSVADHNHSYDKATASLTGTTTFLTSASGTFFNGATVSTLGILSWTTATVSTNNNSIGITTTYNSTTTGENGGHVHSITLIPSHAHSISIASQVIVSGITTTEEAGSHTHTITNEIASTVGTVAVAISSHTHSISISNHTHSVQVSGNNY